MAMPARLGRYVVVRRIGAGAFATVWLAYDEQLDSPVAVKVLAENWTDDLHIRGRFIEEGRYLRRVESPHVVTVYDAGELDDGRPYLVMTYADQGTLADRLEIEGLSPAQALEVLRQVGAGLQALHDVGIVHRDVKPANVLFRTTSDGQIKAMVGDLGLGKALDASSRLTMVAGTPNFVAPEQAQAESPDARADQFSLAALGYLLLSGRPPFERVSIGDAATEAAYLSVCDGGREFGPEVDQVLGRALRFDRDQRWESVTTFVEALTDALGDDHRLPPGPWLPIDPDLTQPGVRPSAAAELGGRTGILGSRESVADSGSRQHPVRRVLAVLVCAALIVAAGVGAWAVSSATHGADPAATWVEITDESGQITVSVPSGWALAQNLSGWTPPDQDKHMPAISTGSDTAWRRSGDGALVGFVEASRMPDRVPGHPRCQAQDPVRQSSPASVMVAYTDCPVSASGHGAVIIEQVTQVAANRLMWVQIRADNTVDAYRVLDSIVWRI